MHNLPEQEQLQTKLAEIKSQHSDLKKEIEVCKKAKNCNQVELSRLKKQLLSLEKQVKNIKSSLIPDQPA